MSTNFSLICFLVFVLALVYKCNCMRRSHFTVVITVCVFSSWQLWTFFLVCFNSLHPQAVNQNFFHSFHIFFSTQSVLQTRSTDSQSTMKSSVEAAFFVRVSWLLDHGHFFSSTGTKWQFAMCQTANVIRTYSMKGTKNVPEILHRCINRFSSQIEKKAIQIGPSIHFSCMEILSYSVWKDDNSRKMVCIVQKLSKFWHAFIWIAHGSECAKVSQQNVASILIN